MRVYKATGSDMCCSMGNGRFQYVLGTPATAEESFCGAAGLHACEYVLDCTRYYRLGTGSRFFEAEAEGDIAEDGQNTRISCTRLTLLRELDRKEIAKAAIRYMVRHPRREGWQISEQMLEVGEDRAEISMPGGIAIARGENPAVRGCEGSHLGLIREKDGKITAAWVFTVSGPLQPDVWYTMETFLQAAGQENS